MTDWTDQLFDKIAKQTDLAPRTVEACRRVLVPHELPGGDIGVESGARVAQDMNMFPSAISRAVNVLRRALVELGDLAEDKFKEAQLEHRTEAASSRDVAISRARELFGELEIVSPKRGHLYIGKPLVKTPLHLVQATGNPGEAVIHDLAKLQRIPDMNAPTIEVQYPKEGLAKVQETIPGQARGSRSR